MLVTYCSLRSIVNSVTKDQSGWSFTVKHSAATIQSMKTVQPIRSQPPAWQWRWKQSPMPSAGLPQEVTVGPHMPSSSQIQWACYKKWKMEWVAQTGMCQWPTSTFKNSCGCTAMDMPEWREMTEQIDWWAKQPSQVACFSEDLKCWGAWDTTCGYKARDITPSIAWRREAWKEKALDIFLIRTRQGHSQSNTETVSKATLRKLLRDRVEHIWVFQAHRYHLKLNWNEKYILKKWDRVFLQKQTTSLFHFLSQTHCVYSCRLIRSGWYLPFQDLECGLLQHCTGYICILPQQCSWFIIIFI